MFSPRISLALMALFVSCFCAHAQEQDTVATFNLNKSVITEETKKPMLLNSRGISGEVNTDKLATIPSFLGTPDPIRFVRLLPSVQLNTEVDAGLYMQGSEHSHTMISQEGVPIYGGSHMLGMFSPFNSPHYAGMKYSTSCGQEPRIGGLIDMRLQDTVSRKLSADLNVGLLSAQGTVDIPLGKSSLKVSARRTFINLIYGGLLKYENNAMYYGFTDANVTWTWKPNKKDRIIVDLFGSLDNGKFTGVGMFEKMNATWFNGVGAIHWNHYYSEASLKQTVYYTSGGLDPSIKAFGMYGRLQSYIMDYGYRANLRWKDWDFGARLSGYYVQPENPYSEGHYNDLSNNGDVPIQTGYAAAITPASEYLTKEAAAEIIFASWISSHTLWDKIRTTGGAYGANCFVDNIEKQIIMTTYRDPTPGKSIEVYLQSLKDLCSTPIPQEEVEKTIVAAYGNAIVPACPKDRGARCDW